MKNIEPKKYEKKARISSALVFIILLAIISMFSDMTHEGSSSIIGAYEQFLGASPLAISIVSGLGMLIGYALRLVTGYFVDRTKKYWLFTILGYVFDLIMIPLLALVPQNGWLLAVSFVLLEKMGKAIKKPAKNALVSFAAKQNGTGKSFAFSELLDQLGAFVGPLMLSATFLATSSLSEYDRFRIGFLVLGIPALVCFILLFATRIKYPHPETFEKEDSADKKAPIFNKRFTIFLIGSCLLAFGFVDFPLFTAHVASLNLFKVEYLPLIYSFAMLIDAVAAMIFGLIYDKKGFLAIVLATLVTSSFAFFFFFFNQYWSIFLGATLWGVGMGAQESIILSGVTDLTSKSNRAKAFGVFDILFGLSWFLGSLLYGFLYEKALIVLPIVSFAAILCSVGFFFYLYKKKEI
ncbi:MAG TPA: MFS transporter [Bacilli bacterium]|nr:MFS transporter [Bacilli bacterium]HPS19218.1 MFS transporter [Bacilli bacterium]